MLPAASALSLTPFIEGPALGEYHLRTCFSSEAVYPRTSQVVKVDLMKSCIQKYLRRRKGDNMLWWAMEMRRMVGGDIIGEDPVRKQCAQAVLSNLRNRLLVMLDEELCVVEVSRYNFLRESIGKIRGESFAEDVELLSVICGLLCDSKLVRSASDICGFFLKRLFQDKSPEEEIGAEDALYMSGRNIRPVPCEGDALVRFVLSEFRYWFSLKNSNAYYWAFRMFVLRDKVKLKEKKFRRDEPVYLLWECMYDYCVESCPKECLPALLHRLEIFHQKDKTERKIFLVNAINMLFLKDELNIEETTEFASKAVVMLKTPEEYMVIDDYCVDMHCRLGRSMGKDRSDFALEGSRVVDEYSPLVVPEWRAFYNAEKLKDPSIVKKKKSGSKKNKRGESSEEPRVAAAAVKKAKSEEEDLEVM